MTKEEWLNIGYQNGLIELETSERVLFKDVYSEWFKGRCGKYKPATNDRIEVTYNRYYAYSAFVEMCTSTITEKDIITFFNACIASNCSMTKKEYDRMYQIAHAVLIYVKDLGYKGSKLYDWDVIKRNTPIQRSYSEKTLETALSKNVVKTLLDAVLTQNVYPLKRSDCLLLCMNFYLGLRIGELAALQFSDFDLEKRVVTIVRSDSKTYDRDDAGNKLGLNYKTADTKTAYSHRVIPLVPECIYIYKLIESHHKAKGYNTPYLCYDGTDTIRIRSLDRTLRRLCKLCNLTPFNSHRIRKTFASMLHFSNVPTKVISQLLGHADMITTQKHYILSFTDVTGEYYGYMRDSLRY